MMPRSDNSASYFIETRGIKISRKPPESEPRIAHAHGPVLPHQVAAILGLSPEQTRELQEIGLIPPATCDPQSGLFHYDAGTLAALREEMHRSGSYSAAVDYWLNRNREE